MILVEWQVSARLYRASGEEHNASSGGRLDMESGVDGVAEDTITFFVGREGDSDSDVYDRAPLVTLGASLAVPPRQQPRTYFRE
mmetsp:Transcript_54536/g.144100  ORF Transcript_54536/g.144100 Transcript_54536/m.144100 type:complete len:84 (+) Transcript_54536:1175-1426(+)